MKHYVLLSKQCNNRCCSLYTMRIYVEKIDILADFNTLPEFFGSGSCKIEGKTCHIFGLTINESKSTLLIKHYKDLIKQLKALGVKEIVWERHKGWLKQVVKEV